MVQIIQRPEREPSLGERLSAGLNAGLQGYGQMQQQHQRQQAVEQLGLDPRILQLPEKAQAEYFKHAFSGEKGLNALQQSQQRLNEERLNALKGQQNFFQRLFGDENESEAPSGEDGAQGGPRKIDLKSIPDEKLRQAAAFAGQPDQKGVFGNMAKGELDRRTEEKKTSPEFQREQILIAEQAKSDTKYVNDVNERRSKQILKKESLNRLEAMGKKKVTGNLYEKFLENIGLTALTSEGRREYSAEAKNQFTDFKQIAGSQLSAREFFVLTSAYPNADFSPEANQAIVNNLKDVHDTLDKEFEIVHRLKKENKGKTPEYIQEKVNTELQDYVSKKVDKMKENFRKIMHEEYGIQPGFVLMFDPQGEPLEISPEEVGKYEELGAVFP